MIALGAGIAPVVMLGILGFPALAAGVVMLGVAFSRVRENHGATRTANTLGYLLAVLASVGLAASALRSTMLTATYEISLDLRLPSHGLVNAGDAAVMAFVWLVVPSVAALAIYLLGGWRGRRLASWWLLAFAAQPMAVLLFLGIAAGGAPLTT